MANDLSWKLNVILLQQQRLSAAHVEHALALVKDPGWRAALTILTSDMFENDSRVWNHVDLRNRSIFFENMLQNGGFSGGELRLLKIAASLFNQDTAVNLYTVFNTLDDDNTALALRAITAFNTDENTPPAAPELPKPWTP